MLISPAPKVRELYRELYTIVRKETLLHYLSKSASYGWRANHHFLGFTKIRTSLSCLNCLALFLGIWAF